MRRTPAFLCAAAVLTGWLLLPARANAQSMDFGGSNAAPASEPAPATPSSGPIEELEVTPAPHGGAPAAAAPANPNEINYSDIRVIQRKAFLKNGRFELAPSFGLTVNDPLLQHYAVGGEANYFLSDSFSVGIEANVFIHRFLSAYYDVPLGDRVLPDANQYNFEGAFDLGYVPIYGKFAFLETGIIHWEGWVSAGAGLTQTQIIPRNPSDPSWTNNNITPNVGAGVRVFLNHWLTFRVGVRDYMMLDTFETPCISTAMPMTCGTLAQRQALSRQQFIQNVVMFFGVSWYLPPWFEYTTNR